MSDDLEPYKPSVWKNSIWNEFKEETFLRGLGTYRSPGEHLRIPLGPEARRDLFRGYLEGISKRTDWTDIDRDYVIKKARELLQEAEKAFVLHQKEIADAAAEATKENGA